MEVPEGYVKIEWDSKFKDSKGQPFKIVAVLPEEGLYALCDDHCLITKMCDTNQYIDAIED